MANKTSLSIGLVNLVMLGALAGPGQVEAAEPQAPQQTPTHSENVAVGVNFNDGTPLRPEFSEHIFRDAADGRWPVPVISTTDLAHGLQSVTIQGNHHPLSGGIQKLTDGAGPVDDDEPGDCFFFDDGVGVGQFRISLPGCEPIDQINIYSWHRNVLSGGVRAPQRIDVYASDGAVDGFVIDDPHGPGYRLLARIDTTQTGGVQPQSGQHGSCIHSANEQPLGSFQHFIFQVHPPMDGVTHTFLCEVDVVRAEVRKELLPSDSAAFRQFDEQVAPLLVNRCLGCHNGSDKKGGLDLSRQAGFLKGGESGETLAAGSPDDSYLLSRVEADEMPPKHPLSDQEKRILRDWIARGSVWGCDPIDTFRFTTETRAGYDWWAWQPPVLPAAPVIKDTRWPANEIDRYVLARLESSGLAPSPAADRRTLIRRATFDLIGLPPTPEEVAAFESDASADAYPRLIDRLLALPQHGERWARHWLDVIRFAESQGFERNKFYPSAWKYRDWVIQSLNDDLPYDEFVRQQLAGDVLHPDDPRAIIATGYLVCTPHDMLGLMQGSDGMKAATREDELENLVGNVGQTFLGLTINCARCHDHKFDPLAQAEYFQLASALGGIRRSERTVAPQPDSLPSIDLPPLLAAIGLDAQQQFDAARAEGICQTRRAVADAQAAYDESKKKPADDNSPALIADRQRELLAAQDELCAAQGPLSTCGLDHLLEQAPADRKKAWSNLVMQLSAAEMRWRLAAGGTVHGVESSSPQYFHVLARGSFRTPGAAVTPRGFQCLVGLPNDWGLQANVSEAQRRYQLAKWITDERNPLIARTIVNRLWHYHFGVGLVDTPSDFGFSGGRPSHPELLDWLACELVRHDWSLKHLHRRIMLSATYQQSSQTDAQAVIIDASNRLLWRKSPQRLEAEAARDAVLAISGQLNPRMGGPSFGDLQRTREDNIDYQVTDGSNAALHRRTIYRTTVRATTSPLLETLDCADPNVSTPRRNVTTTPLQALSLLNNPLIEHAAEAFAKRLGHEAGASAAEQVERAYQLAFNRAPTATERAKAAKFVQEFGLPDFCLILFNTNEFLYID